MERPFIIYTLRRTGGTSLTTFMSRISAFPSVEHEPFNKERIWGPITAEVQKGLGGAALRARLAEVLAQRPNIKHCVEVVPMAISRTLIDLCNDLGYQQFVLHRRHEKDRLVSLYLAMATGAWGPSAAADIYPKLRSGEVKPAPIDLAKVPERIRIDAGCLGEVLMRLRARQIDFDWQIFEELYADPAATRAAALSIAARLGVAVADTDPRLAVFSSASGQRSSEVFDLVPQAAELKTLLERVLG